VSRIAEDKELTARDHAYLLYSVVIQEDPVAAQDQKGLRDLAGGWVCIGFQSKPHWERSCPMGSAQRRVLLPQLGQKTTVAKNHGGCIGCKVSRFHVYLTLTETPDGRLGNAFAVQACPEL